MDRPDGLGSMQVAAAIGLTVLAIASVVAGFIGTLLLFHVVSTQVYYLIYGDHVIAGLVTAVLLVSAALRWSGRRVPRWWLSTLAGSSVGAWIAAIVNGGNVSV